MAELFHSVRMEKIRAICLNEDKYSVIESLHKLGIVDLRKSQLNIKDDISLPDSQYLSESLIKVDGALAILAKRSFQNGRRMSVNEIKKALQDYDDLDSIYKLNDELQSISEDNKLLEYAVQVAGYFDGIDIDFGKLSSGVLSFRSIILSNKEFEKFERMSDTIRKGSEVVTRRIDKKSALVFVAFRKNDEKVEEVFNGLKGIEIDLHAKYLDSNTGHVIKACGLKKSQNLRRAGEISSQLSRLSDKNYGKLSMLRDSLEVELARAEASSVFKSTDKAFVLEGWIPKASLADLRSSVSAATKNRFVIEEVKTDEIAPTLVKRPAMLKPFDYLMEFFSVPRSDEIDPTWIFIISFPIFYGLMISDVGYGIASFLLSSFIIMKTDPEDLLCNTAKIWRLCAISAIIFGFLSDQYFGFPLNHLFTNFSGFSWFNDITSIIVFSIAFGIIQVSLGLAFGAINERRHGNKKLAISKITSIIALVFGTFAVSGLLFHALNSQFASVSAAITVVAFVATIALSGVEAAEVTNLLTHPLSYARIMGFGLGSIIIAMLIDQGFTPNLNNGILLFILYLIIFIVLHLLNMVLSIFEGIIQGVRLNFVEFFSKFYKGGGVKYRPFSYKQVYAKEKNVIE